MPRSHQNIEVYALTTDHKPSKKKEKERIEKMRGEVKPIEKSNGQGVNRVWVKGQQFPGLAMSRSFGDNMAHSVGAIAEPDICKLDLDTENFDYIIVSASDGLWDALSIEKVKQYIRKIFIRTMAVEDCCNFLARDARL